MIVESAFYCGGARMPGPVDVTRLAEARERATGEDSFVWVGLHEPTPEEMDTVARQFDLHPLAVEDAVNAHQRPKLEHYGDGLFLVLKTLWYVDAEDAVETGEINLFLGPGYIVTVRHGEGNGLQSARSYLEGASEVLSQGASAVVYAVCDLVVDEYQAVAASLEVDVDEVERSVFSSLRTRDAERIYTLKREIAEVRRAVLPLRLPMRSFAAGRVEGIRQESRPFFRDVDDHLSRVAEIIDNLDGLLSSAFDAHVARISVQQNEDMRTISAYAALVVVPTLIAGIYGMNFEHMPELRWPYGYPFALVLMALSSSVLWAQFKRSGWL